jgi:hypothetical protein
MHKSRTGSSAASECASQDGPYFFSSQILHHPPELHYTGRFAAYCLAVLPFKQVHRVAAASSTSDWVVSREQDGFLADKAAEAVGDEDERTR